MKKLLTLIAVFLLLSTPVFASQLFNGQTTSQWSTDRTATATVVEGPCVLHGVIVTTDATNDVTITIADTDGNTYLFPAATVVSGTVYAKTPWFAGATPPVKMTGIVVTVSVAGAGTCKYKVQYDQ